MPPAHEGRYDHLHTLISAGRVVGLLLPLPDGDPAAAGVRSTVAGSLTTAIASLEAASAEHDVARLEHRPPSASLFKGDDDDVSKLKALNGRAGRCGRGRGGRRRGRPPMHGAVSARARTLAWPPPPPPEQSSQHVTGTR